MTSGICSAGFTDQDVYLGYEETYYIDGIEIDGGEGGGCNRFVEGICLDHYHGKGQPADAPAARPVTLADIAHFRPTPPIDTMEPNGWAIIGLDTNFYSTSATEVVEGTLLGQPASVRFTPVRWRWNYGDGSSSAASTKGASWKSQGILEFDPTPTSHVYRAPGTYTIGLAVDFTAEYRFGASAWTRIPGALSVPANPLEATAGDAKTVLVARDCIANPAGPGC